MPVKGKEWEGSGELPPPSPPPSFLPNFPSFPPLPFCHGGAAALLLSSSLFKFMDGGRRLGQDGERRENERPGFSRGISYSEVGKGGRFRRCGGTLKTSKIGFWESFLPRGEVNARRGKLLLSPFLAPKRRRSKEIHFPLFMSRDASTRGHKVPSRRNQHSSFSFQ